MIRILSLGHFTARCDVTVHFFDNTNHIGATITTWTHRIVHPCRADHVINQEEEDVVQRVLEITGGEGAYAALDPIAGDFSGTVSRASLML